MKVFMVAKSKNVAGKESEQVNPLGMKTAVTSKATATAIDIVSGEPQGNNNTSCSKNQNKPTLGNPQIILPTNRKKKNWK